MTRPCSNDLRERVVRTHLMGELIRPVAARYRVLGAQMGCALACDGERGAGQGWRPPQPHRDLLRRLVDETPLLTIDRLQDQLASHGIAVCRDTIWRFLRCEGLRFRKKTLFALE